MPIYDFNRAVLRAPSRSVVNGLSATGHAKPDFDGVVSEHTAYSQALESAGISTEILPALDEFPDSIFVEDTALVFPDAAIAFRPGAPPRRGETPAILPALERNFPRVLYLNDGTVDGGDVLATPKSVLIGQSPRTNAQGTTALIRLLAEIGLQGIAVSTPKHVLHFKSDCSLLDDETILATPQLASTGVFEGFRVLLTPEGEEAAANAVRLKDRVLICAAYPRTADLLTNAGYQVVPLATREISKIDAGLSCMSLRWMAI